MDQKPNHIPSNPEIKVELSPIVREHPLSEQWDEVDLDEQDYLDRLAASQKVSR